VLIHKTPQFQLYSKTPKMKNISDNINSETWLISNIPSSYHPKSLLFLAKRKINPQKYISKIINEKRLDLIINSDFVTKTPQSSKNT
jgi:hypothetical protein